MGEDSRRALERAGAWFLRSGIQLPEGGFARYYRTDTGRNAPISTEITGYSISALVYLHCVTGEPAYQAAARRGGEFLLAHAWDRSARVFPFEHGTGTERLAYFFDSGIIARGLLSLWRVDGDGVFLECARGCAQSMSRFAAGRDFHPVLGIPLLEPVYDGNRWSRNAGCYQLKAAMAWHEAGMVEAYEAAVLRSLEIAYSFLPGTSDQEKVMDRLHAYCYFLEGLLPAAGRSECRSAISRGIKRVFGYVQDIAPVFERSDVIAQLLRVRIFADALGIAELDQTTACAEAARIAGYQIRSADPRTDGGFYFGRRRGEFTPFVNPVSTAFCLQTLNMWTEHQSGAFHPNWQVLI